MRKYARLLSAGVIAALSPGSAWACGACALADPKNWKTYLEMTAFMSSVPLLMIGGMVYWLRRHYSSAISDASPSRRPLPGTRLLPHTKLFSH